MAYGGKRTAGDRVLESKHVIGLFLLMLLFSGVFFSLGYVMGKNQLESQVRAAAGWAGRLDPAPILPKAESTPRKSVKPSPAAGESDPATSSSNSDWEALRNNKPVRSEPHLDPAPKPVDTAPSSARSLNGKSKVQPQPVSAPAAKNSKPPSTTVVGSVPNGTYVLQVAALLKQDDALAVAGSLQRKHYTCYVQAPQRDKYYRVQVGPFRDRKAADAAKLGLENEGFRAFYVKR